MSKSKRKQQVSFIAGKKMITCDAKLKSVIERLNENGLMTTGSCLADCSNVDESWKSCRNDEVVIRFASFTDVRRLMQLAEGSDLAINGETYVRSTAFTFLSGVTGAHAKFTIRFCEGLEEGVANKRITLVRSGLLEYDITLRISRNALPEFQELLFELLPPKKEAAREAS